MCAGVLDSKMQNMLHASDDDLPVDAAHADPAPRLVNDPLTSPGRRPPRTSYPSLSLWGGAVVVGAKSERTRAG